ncbi:unnamed protein product [Discula destructiva]
MATLVGDYGPSHSAGFHTMIATQGLPYSKQHQDSSRYPSNSHSRDATPGRLSVTRQKSSPQYSSQEQKEEERDSAAGTTERAGASRLPSPPDSTSPSSSADIASRSHDSLPAQAPSATQSQHGHVQAHMDPSALRPAQGSTAAPPASSPPAPLANVAIPQPSPAIDNDLRWNPPGRLACQPPANQRTIHIRDLAHVQLLAQTKLNQTGVVDPPLQSMKYEISGMPISDIIEMVAALLTKITTTNDLNADALSRTAIERNASHVKQAQAQNDGSATEHSMSPLSSSVLAFHGKNVPAITILSYLSRIHKYCPTTYEVFLSLLVYFDRMTERVNNMVLKAEEAKKAGQSLDPVQSDVVMKDDDSSDSDDLDEDIADDDSDSSDGQAPTPSGADSKKSPQVSMKSDETRVQPTFFVVDSFNIHRLIIAGVTCSSKFFSDVFYTNSRYAKVGGLPLAELNHLEIQFLILNDFRLAVPVEDLEAYATMLVEFYAREVVNRD